MRVWKQEAESAESGEIRSREDFSFNLCPHTGWSQQEEVKVISSCNGTPERKITAQYRSYKGKLQNVFS